MSDSIPTLDLVILVLVPLLLSVLIIVWYTQLLDMIVNRDQTYIDNKVKQIKSTNSGVASTLAHETTPLIKPEHLF